MREQDERFLMHSLQKAIDYCGGQANLAKRISENLPDSVVEPVTPQQVWNWLNRDKTVPAQYCPTIEKICEGTVVCEELNDKADWASVRKGNPSARNRRSTDKNQ